jgi:hypothetical protein
VRVHPGLRNTVAIFEKLLGLDAGNRPTILERKREIKGGPDCFNALKTLDAARTGQVAIFQVLPRIRRKNFSLTGIR